MLWTLCVVRVVVDVSLERHGRWIVGGEGRVVRHGAGDVRGGDVDWPMERIGGGGAGLLSAGVEKGLCRGGDVFRRRPRQGAVGG